MNATDTSLKAAVIGAGISGLSAAYQLKKHGIHPVLLEKNDHAGGRMESVADGDFIFDFGTIASMGGNPQFQEMIDASGLGDSVTNLATMVAGIIRDGKLNSIGTDRAVRDFMGTALFSTASKLKLAKLAWPIVRHAKLFDARNTAGIAPLDTDTVHDYAVKHCNEEIADYLCSPLIRAIWAGDAADKSVVQLLWTLRQFAYPLYCFPRGNGSLAVALAKQHDIRYNCTVDGVEATEQGVRVEYVGDDSPATELFDACIIAMPPPVAKNLYPQLQGIQKTFLDSIEYDANLAVHIGLSSRPDNRDTMIMYPEREYDDAGVAYINHNKSPGRAPAGKGSISLYFTTRWSNANYRIEDQLLINRAIERLAPFIDNLENSIEVVRVKRWEKFAMNEKPGMYGMMDEYNQSLRSQPDQRVQFASDFMPRSGVNQAVSNGFACADRVIHGCLGK